MMSANPQLSLSGTLRFETRLIAPSQKRVENRGDEVKEEGDDRVRTRLLVEVEVPEEEEDKEGESSRSARVATLGRLTGGPTITEGREGPLPATSLCLCLSNRSFSICSLELTPPFSLWRALIPLSLEPLAAASPSQQPVSSLLPPPPHYCSPWFPSPPCSPQRLSLDEALERAIASANCL